MEHWVCFKPGMKRMVPRLLGCTLCSIQGTAVPDSSTRHSDWLFHIQCGEILYEVNVFCDPPLAPFKDEIMDVGVIIDWRYGCTATNIHLRFPQVCWPMSCRGEVYRAPALLFTILSFPLHVECTILTLVPPPPTALIENRNAKRLKMKKRGSRRVNNSSVQSGVFCRCIQCPSHLIRNVACKFAYGADGGKL